jgi:hypothetical protein
MSKITRKHSRRGRRDQGGLVGGRRKNSGRPSFRQQDDGEATGEKVLQSSIPASSLFVKIVYDRMGLLLVMKAIRLGA